MAPSPTFGRRHPGWMLYALALVLIVFGVNTSGG